MPVLVLAGDPRVDDVFEVLHAGADDFIRKPVLGPDHVALAMRRFHKYRAAAADADRLRLEQAQARKAEELSLDKLRFFRFASHELKSPLVAVQSNLRTIREIFGDRVPEEVREMLGRSGARLDQLLGMINDLLALSVDRSDIRDYWQVVDLSQLVRDALSHLAPVARERGVTVEARLPRRRVTLVCNLYGLEKAVGNLLSNAVRYTPAGGRATVELERKDHFQVIRVSDTGIGIPAEDREKVFDEFYRAKNARAAVSFGSGLGLALVKKVVLEHGGWIDLQSVEGEGTTISLWLPVRAPEPQA
jgi:signal transduction histidine kinase